ncbi:RNA-directed DNA polymerase, eukaryota, reverse transcriptase zinc-binding domain protein [Tanacetum coccineum]
MRSKRDQKIPQILEDFVHNINTTKTKNKAKDSHKNTGWEKDIDVKGRKECSGFNGELYEDQFPPISSQLDKDKVNDKDCLVHDTVGTDKDCLDKKTEGIKNGNSDRGEEDDVCNKENKSKSENVESNNKESNGGVWNLRFADIVKGNQVDNKSKVIATEIDEKGNVTYNEARYHLRRMWNKFGFIDIVKNDEGVFFFKFQDEKGMDEVICNGPWLVKILNVPMEAWSVKGISALASCLELKKKIEVVYKGSKCHEKFTKIIQVEYVWKPPYCDICKVFGYDKKGCRLKEKEENEINKEKGRKDDDKLFTEVQYRITYIAKENQNMRKWNGNNGMNVNRGYFGIQNRVEESVSQKMKVDSPKGKSNENISKGKCNCLGKALDEEQKKDADETTYNRFTLLDSLVGEEELIPSLEKRKIVDEFMNKEKEGCDFRKQRWNKEMEKCYKDMNELFDAAKDLEQDEDMNSEIQIDAEFGKRNEKNEGDRVETVCKKVRLFCTMVYASNSYMERRKLWRDLGAQKSITKGEPWVIMGDFNVTLKLEEHSNGSSAPNSEMNEFAQCVREIEVDDILSSGFHFTWTKSRGNPKCKTLKKLDRIIINEAFVDKFHNSSGIFLPYMISDHSPTVLKLPNGMEKRRKAFRFSNFVMDKKEFIPIVKKAWEVDIEGHMMYRVVKNMKLLKLSLNKLSWVNGNIFERVKKLRECLKEIQIEVDKNPHDEEIKAKSCKILSEYYDAMKDENNLIVSICNEKGERFENDKIVEQFVKHFQEFLGKKDVVTDLPTEEIVFSNKLSREEKANMCRGVSEVEVKNAMFEIEDSKAPGPDGFTVRFYKSAWSIIGKDICKAVQEFFITGKLLGEVNATLISLVPKVQNPDKVFEFRPIACCNVMYKCISKIITNRLKGVLGNLIHESQSAFIAVLEQFGFPNRMVEWIMVCVSTTKFSININGEREGYFCGGRGLRQGDPMSPYLFTLVMEVFNIIMRKNISEAKEFKYHKGCKKLEITHLCFVDDLLVFCHGDTKSVNVIKETLKEFNRYYGLKANMSKSTVFFGGMTKAEQDIILDIVPFGVKKLPVKYIGVPLITKKITANDCKPLIEKVKSRILDWRNKALSYSGRLQLIASVLSAMQIYWASVFLLPKNVIYEINKMLKGFLWCQGELTKGKAKISWKSICKPKEQGGLGIKNLQVWNEVLIVKQLWKVIAKKDTLWVKWVNTENLKGKSIWEITAKTNSSAGWKEMLKLRDKIRKHVLWKIRNGMSINAWYDNWSPSDKHGKENLFSVKVVWNDFIDEETEVDWLNTQKMIDVWNLDHDMKCVFCNQCMDSIRHLFFTCDFTLKIWKEVHKLLSVNMSFNWIDIVEELKKLPNNQNIWSIVRKLVFGAEVYYMWQERNSRLFKKEVRDGKTLSHCIREVVQLKISGFAVKESRAVRELEERWNIKIQRRNRIV